MANRAASIIRYANLKNIGWLCGNLITARNGRIKPDFMLYNGTEYGCKHAETCPLTRWLHDAAPLLKVCSSRRNEWAAGRPRNVRSAIPCSSEMLPMGWCRCDLCHSAPSRDDVVFFSEHEKPAQSRTPLPLADHGGSAGNCASALCGVLRIARTRLLRGA